MLTEIQQQASKLARDGHNLVVLIERGIQGPHRTWKTSRDIVHDGDGLFTVFGIPIYHCPQVVTMCVC